MVIFYSSQEKKWPWTEKWIRTNRSWKPWYSEIQRRGSYSLSTLFCGKTYSGGTTLAKFRNGILEIPFHEAMRCNMFWLQIT